MLGLEITKLSDSNIHVPHGTVVHANSSYSVRVRAREFAFDVSHESRLRFVKDGVEAAACSLTPDSLRRPDRVGELHMGDVGGEMRLVVTLGDAVLFSHPVKVAGSDGSPGVDPTPASGRWTVVDLGTLHSGDVPVNDMEQVKVTASHVPGPLNVLAPDAAFEAYVVVVGTAGRFPFTEGVTVNGAYPTWDHMDSLQLAESMWTLHLVRVAGVVHADLRAGRPSGTERDSNGDLVTSTEVNR